MKNLNDKTRIAVYTARRLARVMRGKSSRIVADYRSGASESELARTYVPKYPASPQIAKTAIYYILHRVIKAGEMRRLARKHEIEASKRISHEVRRQAGIQTAISKGDVPYTGILRDTEYGRVDEKAYIILLR